MLPITVLLIDGPITSRHPSPCTMVPGAAPEAGAVVCFDGIVRATEDGKPLTALNYEAYLPLTQRELEKLARQIADEFSLIAITVLHSVGRVPIGDCSFRLKIAAAHRKPALLAMDAFIDRMKKTIPLWKTSVWDEQKT